MTRQERLMATLRGDPVDRPPVSFYELNGLDENPDDPDPFYEQILVKHGGSYELMLTWPLSVSP